MSVVGERLQPTLFERSPAGRGGGKVPHPPKDALDRIPAEHARDARGLPELNEPEVVRHYVNLSQLNYAVDTGFYPLGSCTMKYNPKINEWAARLPGLRRPPPAGPRRGRPGHARAAVGAGAMAGRDQRHARGHAPAGRRRPRRADRHPDDPRLPRARGDLERTEVLVPTRPTAPTRRPRRWPASEVIRSRRRRRRRRPRRVPGRARPADRGGHDHQPVDAGPVRGAIGELLDAVHEAGALAYMDGANLNAILGRFKPGEAGFDVMHFNTHKTFTTPHGGGGPGAGPVGVGGALLPFLPAPRVLRDGRRDLPAGARPASGRPRSAACARSSAAPASWCAPTPTSAPTAGAACAR